MVVVVVVVGGWIFVLFFEINIFLGKTSVINKYPQCMMEIEI